MHDPNRPVRLHDDQRGNFRFVEKLQCLARQLVRTDGFGRGGHYRVDRGLQQIRTHMTAPVASTMATQPKPLADISTIASDIGALRPISGTAAPGCMTSRTNFNAAPSLPRG